MPPFHYQKLPTVQVGQGYPPLLVGGVGTSDPGTTVLLEMTLIKQSWGPIARKGPFRKLF